MDGYGKARKDDSMYKNLRVAFQTGNSRATGGPEGTLYDTTQNAHATIAERVASKH